jgi:BNR repeat-like domain
MHHLIVIAVLLILLLATPQLAQAAQGNDPAIPLEEPEEWKRSNPDIVVYLPRKDREADSDNEHFLVFKAPKSEELLATWTQSSVEGRGDNHLVLSRSADAGATWSDPAFIVGTTPGSKEPQASWGFPVISKQGRIYLFYTKQTDASKLSPQGSGPMGCVYSDDNALTWTPGADTLLPRNRFDDPDAGIAKNWIVWQKPIRDSKGRWLAGYTQVSSTNVVPNRDGWWTLDSRCAFMRFENIDDNPDPKDLKIAWLPTDSDGLEVSHRYHHDISVSQEPGVVLLPDGRLFTTMRTMTGYIWCSISADDGATWSTPKAMFYSDKGEPIKHPLSPCPLYALEDGRFLLLFHNNDGTRGEASMFKRRPKKNQANHVRNPTYIAVGHFKPEAAQPIWFDAPIKLLDTNDVIIGPKGTAEIGTYTSITEYKGKRILWYPDRKYFLLGKYLTDDVLKPY